MTFLSIPYECELVRVSIYIYPCKWKSFTLSAFSVYKHALTHRNTFPFFTLTPALTASGLSDGCSKTDSDSSCQWAHQHLSWGACVEGGVTSRGAEEGTDGFSTQGTESTAQVF